MTSVHFLRVVARMVEVEKVELGKTGLIFLECLPRSMWGVCVCQCVVGARVVGHLQPNLKVCSIKSSSRLVSIMKDVQTCQQCCVFTKMLWK